MQLEGGGVPRQGPKGLLDVGSPPAALLAEVHTASELQVGRVLIGAVQVQQLGLFSGSLIDVLHARPLLARWREPDRIREFLIEQLVEGFGAVGLREVPLRGRSKVRTIQPRSAMARERFPSPA